MQEEIEFCDYSSGIFIYRSITISTGNKKKFSSKILVNVYYKKKYLFMSVT